MLKLGVRVPPRSPRGEYTVVQVLKNNWILLLFDGPADDFHYVATRTKYLVPIIGGEKNVVA